MNLNFPVAAPLFLGRSDPDAPPALKTPILPPGGPVGLCRMELGQGKPQGSDGPGAVGYWSQSPAARGGILLLFVATPWVGLSPRGLGLAVGVQTSHLHQIPEGFPSVRVWFSPVWLGRGAGLIPPA